MKVVNSWYIFGPTKHRRTRDLCDACATGDHRHSHGLMGCTATVADEPRDYVCRCEVGAQAMSIGKTRRTA